MPRLIVQPLTRPLSGSVPVPADKSISHRALIMAAVANGCSELLGQVFGPEVGAHARSAFGVAQLPLGACVEIELIAEIK